MLLIPTLCFRVQEITTPALGAPPLLIQEGNWRTRERFWTIGHPCFAVFTHRRETCKHHSRLWTARCGSKERRIVLGWNCTVRRGARMDEWTTSAMETLGNPAACRVGANLPRHMAE